MTFILGTIVLAGIGYTASLIHKARHGMAAGEITDRCETFTRYEVK